MRLTLRNLLGYMDNNLKPEDALELGRKIEESEFATNLLKRVRDVMRRLRLAAPSVTSTGPGLDPNTVAEYLDHVLPSDRVPDFEKVCLESDVHLAEVASCHQILSLVLREPAEVEPNTRERMYQLTQTRVAPSAPDQATGAPPTASGETSPTEQEDTSGKLRHKPMVPEYLREPPLVSPRHRWWLPVAATLAMAILVTVILLAAFHQFESGSALCNALGLSSPAPIAQGQPIAPAAKTTPTTESTPAAKPMVATDLTPAKTVTSPTVDPSSKTAPPVAGALPPADKPLADKPSADSAPAAKTPVVSPESPTKAAPAAPDLKPATPASEMAGSRETTPPPPAPGGPVAGKPETPPHDAMAKSTPATISPSGFSPIAEPAPLPPERLGRLISEKQVLLQADAANNGWRRVLPQAVVNTSVRLLSLPPFQPLILIATRAGDRVNVQLQGGTQVELLSTDAQGVPGLSASFGRLVIRPLSDGKARVRLQTGSRSGTITLKNAETTVAAAIWRNRALGTNPESHPGPIVAELYAVSGEFVWDEGPGRPSIDVRAPARLLIGVQPIQAPTALTEVPKWITTDETPLLEQRAATTIIEPALAGDRTVDLVLRELSQHRQKEVRSLTVRALSYLGYFEPMVAVLNSTEPRSWNESIGYLAAAIDQGPESAVDVRRSLEKAFPQDANLLYRMLWGYSEDDLRNGEAINLVNALNHDTLPCRVLAFANLKRLSGGAEYTYSPRDPANKRNVGVARWIEWRDRFLNTKPEEKEKKPSPTPAAPAPASSVPPSPATSPSRDL